VFETSRESFQASISLETPCRPTQSVTGRDYEKEIANKPNVMAAQRKLLESRYILEPKLDPQLKMTRGKPVPVGPTARLQAGTYDLRKFNSAVFSRIRPSGTRCKARLAGISQNSDRYVSTPGAI